MPCVRKCRYPRNCYPHVKGNATQENKISYDRCQVASKMLYFCGVLKNGPQKQDAH